jgi:hypothetical protein
VENAGVFFSLGCALTKRWEHHLTPQLENDRRTLESNILRLMGQFEERVISKMVKKDKGSPKVFMYPGIATERSHWNARQPNAPEMAGMFAHVSDHTSALPSAINITHSHFHGIRRLCTTA